MTPLYDAYLDRIRPTAQIWRLLVGLPLIAGLYVLWMLGMGAVLWAFQGTDGLEATLMRMAGGSDPWALLIMLSTFAGGWLGVALALRWVHKGRRLGTVLGRAPMVLRDFVLGVAFMAGLGGAMALLAAPFLPALEQATPLDAWLAFLPLALVGILVQTGAEELFFRGYMQGQLAARFGQPLIYLLVPSIAFGFAHYSPAPGIGATAWLIPLVTGAFGLVAADLTARSGNLGLAWGLHFANNVLAILLISVMGRLSGLALFHLPDNAASGGLLRTLLLLDLGALALIWASCRLWLRRR